MGHGVIARRSTSAQICLTFCLVFWGLGIDSSDDAHCDVPVQRTAVNVVDSYEDPFASSAADQAVSMMQTKSMHGNKTRRTGDPALLSAPRMKTQKNNHSMEVPLSTVDATVRENAPTALISFLNTRAGGSTYLVAIGVGVLILALVGSVMCFFHSQDEQEMDPKERARARKKKYHHPTGIAGKLSADQSDSRKAWQKQLGEFMESPHVSGVVIFLILVDLACTFVNDMCENTNLINPKYDEQKESTAKLTHNICVTVLCIFFIEQLLHVLAFGAKFFTKFWFVMDLMVVTVSLLCETVLEGAAEDMVAFLVVLRLWKIVGFVFDMCLANNESAEMDEKASAEKAKKDKGTSTIGKLSASLDQEGWRKDLGELMESPRVSGMVIILIFVDLGCTFVNDMCENTKLINPVYDAQKESTAKITHTICVTVLCIFFVEQLLHIVAFGKAFFTKIWFVMDLVVVSVSLLCETVFEGAAEDLVGLLVVLRLWKVVGFVFDMCLASTENKEMDEKERSGLPTDATKAKKEHDRNHTGVTGKLSASPDKEGWQKELGELMESPRVSGAVIILIFTDLACTFVNDICENTNLINPVYDEQKERTAKMTHTICVTVLCIFFVEQLLHLAAFGAKFFTHFWFVMDLVVVSVSLLCETVLEGAAEGVVALLVVLRLWKVVGFIFDTLLAITEQQEMDEKNREEAKGGLVATKEAPPPRHHNGMTGKHSHDPEMKEGWQKDLGELLESPRVSGAVIILILTDLACTFVNDMCENTDLINPVYDERKESTANTTHTICVTVLCIFLVEQLLHLAAFGPKFFTKFWFVMDAVVVLVSLICETVLEDKAEGLVPMLIVLRLWKVVAFIFDVCLADNEDNERDEALRASGAPA